MNWKEQTQTAADGEGTKPAERMSGSAEYGEPPRRLKTERKTARGEETEGTMGGMTAKKKAVVSKLARLCEGTRTLLVGEGNVVVIPMQQMFLECF